jgi:hypothetical protein
MSTVERAEAKAKSASLEIESQIIADVRTTFSSSDNIWTAMKTSNLEIEKLMTYKEGDPILLGKARTIVDTSSEEALAWCWDYCGFERSQTHDEEVSRLNTSSTTGFSRIPRRVTAEHSSVRVDGLSCKPSLIFRFIIHFSNLTFFSFFTLSPSLSASFFLLLLGKRFPNPFHHRAFAFTQTWRREDGHPGLFNTDSDVDVNGGVDGGIDGDGEAAANSPLACSPSGGSYIMAVRPSAFPDDLGHHSKMFVEGKFWSMWLIKPVIGSNNEQCEVEYFSKVDAALWLLLAKTASTLMNRNLQSVRSMRDTFSRDEQIDREKREELIESGAFENKKNTSITADEDEVVESVRGMFERNKSLNMNYLKSPDPQVKMELGYVSGDNTAYMKAEAIVDADIYHCMAYEWDFMSRERTHALIEGGGEDVAVLNESNRSSVTRIALNLGYGLSEREFVNRKVWKMLDNKKTFYIAYDALKGTETGDAANKRFPLNSKYIRGTSHALWKFERMYERQSSERESTNRRSSRAPIQKTSQTQTQTKVTLYQRGDIGKHSSTPFTLNRILIAFMHLTLFIYSLSLFFL